ncbi:MAG: response regulator [Kofleriaceae bacterium]|jgi:two-component system probable response regulator PhcQ|nr:response regulator [Kofleriaceae bacterium]MBP6835824.1 response regulator [Kofleriaceae bacterium]MBP9206931.1 response regulator [Kofleriaceae bacterium]
MKPETPDPRPLVICVDDDSEVLASVARALRRDGYEIVATTEPSEVLALLARRVASVLVSDFEMPQMNGVDLAVAARNVRPETVRILLTGNNQMSTAVSGINVGEVFRFIPKPFDPDHLRREVALAISKHVELAAQARDRDVDLMRQRLLADLDSEYPGISSVRRGRDGNYEVDEQARDRLGAGFEAVRTMTD